MGRVSAGPLPDVAYAAVLAALPEMTPHQLSRLLADAPALELYQRILAGDPSLQEGLLAMGRPRLRERADTSQGGGEAITPGAGRPSRTKGGRAERRAAPSTPTEAVVGPPERPALHREEPMPLFGSPGELERRRQTVLTRLGSWRLELGRRPVEDVWSSVLAAGLSVVRRVDPAYPRRLLRADLPPELLYVKGSLDHAAAPTVAIVGTRRATHYGMEIAGEMGQALAERDIAVVSGLARGIDAAAHAGFLSARHRSAGPVAVVGGGVDVVYPIENRRLWAEVARAGALISEAPPGTPPHGWRFPLRNRIIAGLSQVVVVVESSRQGGAMHTVQAADSFGIPVLAVPGSVRSPQSEGTNAIIGEGGAALATDVYDVLTALNLACEAEGTRGTFPPVPSAADRRSRVGAPPPEARTGRRHSSPADAGRRQALAVCSPEERAVYEALEHTPTTFDVICARTHRDVGTVALALDHLEEAGLARPVGPSWQRL
jgi:DNA processing protein